MSQCVPNWDIDDTNHTLTPRRLSLRSHSNKSAAPDVPTLDYEVAELTWQNGQLAMHGLGPPRAPPKPHSPPSATSPSKYATWDKPRAAVNGGPAVAATGTLESLVNQATALPFHKRPLPDATAELIPWFNHAHASASATMTMDALVPCSDDRTATQFMDSVPGCGLGTCVVGCSKRVGSTSGGETTLPDEDVLVGKKRESGAVMAAAGEAVAPEWSGRDQSVSGSATFGRDSQQVTLDTCERDAGVGFTSTSPENTSSGKGYTKATAAADDSVSHSKPERDRNGEKAQKRNGKSSISTKRSRAAAIHNQSERKRRDKINQRMKTLQKLVPNSSKTDKASVLDEVIEYLKQLQAQVQVMNRMNMQPMMMPLALQQQLQMSMLSPMGMGMGMAGMGMPGIGMLDMNSLSRPTMAGIPPVLHPAANPFVQMGSWDAERMTTPAAMADPVSAFLACQSQPMTLDSYSRLAAMYQQMHQQQPSTSKN